MLSSLHLALSIILLLFWLLLPLPFASGMRQDTCLR